MMAEAARSNDPVSFLLTDEPRSNQASSPAVTQVPTMVLPTAMPVVTMATLPTEKAAEALPLHENEGGIPYSGDTFNVDVAPDEIEVLTAGPAEAAGVKLPGGELRGSLIIMLPDTEGKVVVRYTITGLVPGSNWHGSYRPLVSPGLIWKTLVDDRVAAMFNELNNCSLGIGCDTVDVLVINQEGIVSQQVVNK